MGSNCTPAQGPRQDEHIRARARALQDPSAHKSRQERPQSTARPPWLRLLMKALVVRLDCGPDAHYPDQAAAGRAVDRFVASAALPRPIVVDAGDGLECHWPRTEALPVGRWHRAAGSLEAACVRHGLAVRHPATT